MKRIYLPVIAAGLILGSLAAYAEGIFPDYPTVGEASRCTATSTGPTGQVCTTTVPAGPTAVTGLEKIPADTKIAGGSQPQTVLMSMRALNAAPLTYTLCTSATCGTFVLGNNSGGILFDYTTTITSATVQAPPAPMDGQQVTIAATYTISTLAFTANTGQTLSVTTPTVLTASTTVPQGYSFQYVASTKKWYRIR